MSSRCALPDTLRWRVTVTIVSLPPLSDRTIIREFCDAEESYIERAAMAMKVYNKRQAALCEASWEGVGSATLTLQSSRDGAAWREVKRIGYPLVDVDKLLALIGELS